MTQLDMDFWDEKKMLFDMYQERRDAEMAKKKAVRHNYKDRENLGPRLIAHDSFLEMLKAHYESECDHLNYKYTVFEEGIIAMASAKFKRIQNKLSKAKETLEKLKEEQSERFELNQKLLNRTQRKKKTKKGKKVAQEEIEKEMKKMEKEEDEDSKLYYGFEWLYQDPEKMVENSIAEKKKEEEEVVQEKMGKRRGKRKKKTPGK